MTCVAVTNNKLLLPSSLSHSLPHLATCFQSSSPPVSLLAQLAHTARLTTRPAATEWLEASAPARTCADALPAQLASQHPSNRRKLLHALFKNDPTPRGLNGARRDAEALYLLVGPVVALLLVGRPEFPLAARREGDREGAMMILLCLLLLLLSLWRPRCCCCCCLTKKPLVGPIFFILELATAVGD